MMYEKRRQALLQKLQIMGIRDQRVLQAMAKIPRHRFVPAGLELQAYDDKALPIGYGQTISHPSTVALMTQALDLRGGERVLEIGTGSGYQTAVLCELGCQVYTIEIVRDLASRAQQILNDLKYTYRYTQQVGDGSKGWPRHAPYDRIIVTAGAPVVPERLRDQLAEDGRLLVPVGDRRQQTLTLWLKTRDGWQQRVVGKTVFVPLTGEHGWS